MTTAPELNTNRNPDAELDTVVSNVRNGLGLFTLALKNFALYPQANLIRQQSLFSFHAWLESFLEEFDDLHLDVEKGRLLLASEIVYQDKPNEQALVYPLFRDGIQWFKFTENVTPGEIGEFINLFNRFRILKEEASDDLATALWEANFPHIIYKTADDFWESDPLADIAALKAASDKSDDPEAIARINSGTSTVSYVLRALNKDKDPADEGNTAGLAPKMRMHPTAKAGDEGLDASIEVLESILNGSAEWDDGPLATDPDSGETAEAGANNARGVRSEGNNPRGAFLEILSFLNDSGNQQSQRPISGPVNLENGVKPKISGGPALVEENSGSGSLLNPSHNFDDEDESLAATDTASKSAFRSSSYFDNENSEYIWPLAPNEGKQLRELISTEENRNFNKDCLDILMILLNSAGDQPETTGILDFLTDELQYALSLGDFYFVRVFLEDFNKQAISDQESFGKISAELTQRILTPEFMGILAQSWDDNQLTKDSLAELRRFLLLLPHEAIYTLLSVLTEPQDPRIKKILLQVVAAEVCQINANVVALISALNVSSILELLSIIRSQSLGLPCPTALLQGLSRSDSAHVREEAARTLIEQHPESVKNLFHLIHDPNPALNTVICMQLAKQRSPLVEKVLLDYLSAAYLAKKDQAKEHVLNCYWAFGNSASSRSIPFLQNVLLKKSWKSLFGVDNDRWHRLGAALALMFMPEEWGGQEILEAARQSRFKNIRQACQFAEEAAWEYRRKAGDP